MKLDGVKKIVNSNQIMISIRGNQSYSRVLIFVGSVFLTSSLVFWLGSSLKVLNYFPYAEIFFITSLVLLHFGMVVNSGDTETKVFLIQSNLLSAIGVFSLPFHFNSWIFLVPGLFMAFFSYFVLKLPSARDTQYIWGNALIGLGAYITTFDNEFARYIATGTQIAGFALIGLTIYKSDKESDGFKFSKFDSVSFRLLSIWGLILLLSPLIWIPVLHEVYNGGTWLIEGLGLSYTVTKFYKGFWGFNPPNWFKEKIWEKSNYEDLET